MDTKTEFETLGDLCKAGEMLEADRAALTNEPIICRLDGRGFSKFTKGLGRPFDVRLSNLMINTVKFLVQETQAVIGYTQSDEITLVWAANSTDEETRFFGGRLQKIASTCSALASTYFNRNLDDQIPEKLGEWPTFDGRCWPVDSHDMAFKNLLCRERDAIKNSITMSATTMINHKLLDGVRSEQKKKMMLDLGVDWNDYPTFFKRGVYVKRVLQLKNLTENELSKIPEGRRPAGPIKRSQIITLDLPPIDKIKYVNEVLFNKITSPVIELRDGSMYHVFDYNTNL